MKRENKTIRKTLLTEIIGNRVELEPYLGKTLKCEVFVTNSLGYLGEKRLITEIRIPCTNFYIKHLWVKEWALPLDKVKHGYQKIELKVIDYKDSYNGTVKYGVRYAGEKMRKPSEAKMVIPKWKQEQRENEKMKKEASVTAKATAKTTAKVKRPFGRIRKVK